MISYSEAVKIVEESARVSELSESIPLAQAQGRVLAKALIAQTSNPPFAAAAMDGFAVCSDDLTRASENVAVELALRGLATAGDSAQDFGSGRGTVVEITTGAVVPQPFDAVVRVEDTSSRGDMVVFFKPCAVGENIRIFGEDFASGQELLSKGTRLGPQHVMLGLGAGVSRVEVYKRPLAAVLATGNELLDPAKTPELPSGKIYNSCGPYLEAALPLHGVESLPGVAVDDDRRVFLRELERALELGAEIVLSSGAVSKGCCDFVPGALRDFGAKVHFHCAAVRPGKPVFFAEIECSTKRVLYFGLPGNPLAVAAGLRFFVDPYLRRLWGMEKEKGLCAELRGVVKKPKNLVRFCLGTLQSEGSVLCYRAAQPQQSFMLRPLEHAQVWGVLPEGTAEVQSGTPVTCLPLYPLV